MGQQVQLLFGDCVERMKGLPDSSVDVVVCDPPYGLGFMGFAFDDLGKTTQQRTWHLAWLLEAFRVLQPGGMIKAYAGSRTLHQLAHAIDQAGFTNLEIEAWSYLTGFPKSLDIGRSIDKMGGSARMQSDTRRAFAKELRKKREEMLVSRAELAKYFPQYTSVTSNWERQDHGFRVPNEKDFDVLVCRLGMSEKWRQCIRREDKRRLVASGMVDRRGDNTVIGLGHSGRQWQATTEDALQWDGWGTSLKPSWEPIVIGRKPL